MLYSDIIIPTLKETPSEAEVSSHILMLRAGFIRKLVSGAYSYLPLGFRSLNKVINIVREEMSSALAQEVLLPALQPAELWKRSGRFDVLGEDMISFKDRHGKDMVLGPTHEEVITDLAKNEIKSYKELPVTFYQIQTKFRDEPRPRFGVIRSKEFIMMDAYSFDTSWEGLDKSYEKMYNAYCRIFTRCGLNFIPVEADTGIMGGNVSHEFMVPSPIGEDLIVLCTSCNYAVSFDKAEILKNNSPKADIELKSLLEVHTPNVKSVKDVTSFLKIGDSGLVKTIFYKADGNIVAVLIRGDYEINETKLKNYLKVKELVMADSQTIEKIANSPVGFSGPVGLKEVRIIADYSLIGMSNFVTGANKNNTHLINVNIDRDFKVSEYIDARGITSADLCPKCAKPIKIEHSIEVGHIFKLGTKYSSSLEATFLDESGAVKPMIMGCYGIGVNRIIASCIEQNHDEFGMIFPQPIAPFKIIMLPLNYEDAALKEVADSLYKKALSLTKDVLFDNRPLRAGMKFKDADLMGIPVQIVIGEKNLKENKIEIKLRKGNIKRVINVSDFEKELAQVLE